MRCLLPAEQGCILMLKVTPRAARPGIGAVVEDRLTIRLQAAPVDGKANQELVALLAKRFRIPKGAVEILSGGNSRLKRVMLHGVSVADIATLID